MDIYWIKDKHRCGPATVPDVISLVQMGEITPDTPGWHAGCKGWMPLRRLPALADFLDELQESPAAEAEDENFERENAEEEADGSEAKSRRGGDDFAGAHGGDFSAFGDEPEEPSRRRDAADGRRDEEARPREGQPGEPVLPPLPAKDLASLLGDHPRRVYLPSPGARFMARMVDYALYIIVVYLIIYYLGVPYDERLLPGSFYIWLPCLLLEGLLLSRFGTTPGKALMGIRMSIFGEAEKLSVLRGTARAALVFALGCGLMIFPLIPLTGLLALWRLRRRGITGWDAGCSTIPVQVKPATTERMLLGFTILFGAFMTMSVLIMPWMPSMLADLEAQRPGSTRALSTLIGAPAETPQASPRPRGEVGAAAASAEAGGTGFTPRTAAPTGTAGTPSATQPSATSPLLPLPGFSAPVAPSTAPVTGAAPQQAAAQPSAVGPSGAGVSSSPSSVIQPSAGPASPADAPAAPATPAASSATSVGPAMPSAPAAVPAPASASEQPSEAPTAPGSGTTLPSTVPSQPAATPSGGLPASPDIG